MGTKGTLTLGNFSAERLGLFSAFPVASLKGLVHPKMKIK